MKRKLLFWGMLVMALAFGLVLAGCGSAPAVPTQIITGVIVDSYEGNSVWQSGKKGTYKELIMWFNKQIPLLGNKSCFMLTVQMQVQLMGLE